MEHLLSAPPALSPLCLPSVLSPDCSPPPARVTKGSKAAAVQQSGPWEQAWSHPWSHTADLGAGWGFIVRGPGFGGQTVGIQTQTLDWRMWKGLLFPARGPELVRGVGVGGVCSAGPYRPRLARSLVVHVRLRGLGTRSGRSAPRTGPGYQRPAQAVVWGVGNSLGVPPQCVQAPGTRGFMAEPV